jgi:diguanylate cyclase (GGDEF)-like protein
MSNESRAQDPGGSAEPAAPAKRKRGRFGRKLRPLEDGAGAQTLSDRDQTLADTEQTGSDLDQTSADTDQSASERDQRASDRDQVAADRDQAAGVRHPDGSDEGNGYARTRSARSRSGHERDLASRARAQTARIRDEAASRRDHVAAERDAAALARDELAAAFDAELEWLDHERQAEDGQPPSESDLLVLAAGDRQRAAAARSRAALQRDASGDDRELAAEDRAQAARDRSIAAEELMAEGIDDLTGTMLRRVGLAAIQREIARTRRSGESLVVAFVDVDGLKTVNDSVGHSAGDELLRVVAGSIAHHLRSYDVIARFGGDEFVCSLAGLDAAGARERFEQIRTRLSAEKRGATIAVGLAERGNEDTLDELIDRADTAMIEARQGVEADGTHGQERDAGNEHAPGSDAA